MHQLAVIIFRTKSLVLYSATTYVTKIYFVNALLSNPWSKTDTTRALYSLISDGKLLLLNLIHILVSLVMICCARTVRIWDLVIRSLVSLSPRYLKAFTCSNVWPVIGMSTMMSTVTSSDKCSQWRHSTKAIHIQWI